jgi:hypothetical protein
MGGITSLDVSHVYYRPALSIILHFLASFEKEHIMKKFLFTTLIGGTLFLIPMVVVVAVFAPSHPMSAAAQ